MNFNKKEGAFNFINLGLEKKTIGNIPRYELTDYVAHWTNAIRTDHDIYAACLEIFKKLENVKPSDDLISRFKQLNKKADRKLLNSRTWEGTCVHLNSLICLALYRPLNPNQHDVMIKIKEIVIFFKLSTRKLRKKSQRRPNSTVLW